MTIMVAALPGAGQAPVVIEEGKIVFERKINGHKIMTTMSESGGFPKERLETYKNSTPVFSVSYFTLHFNNNTTVYQPEQGTTGTPVSIDEWFVMVANDNIVQTDLSQGQFIAGKNVFGSNYIVADSLRKIKWKITSEVRTIAGFQCRRANALIMDSIYVVAFYTNEIAPRGGPESFYGLPGMILGVALPYEHITWFAQQVYTSASVNPVKGISGKKRLSSQDYATQINNLTKSWGKASPLVTRKALL
ncbi:GLPGLI family protein [Chitinophaga oryzae]|uniref:GLPGLI family protein n=2 Tax=Chitinophaga oryzae TaxID=2725414 RepID=A0AAE6ZN65_9BACT|nr:GLPGLI family protein [Chitinophaga oryzae]